MPFIFEKGVGYEKVVCGYLVRFIFRGGIGRCFRSDVFYYAESEDENVPQDTQEKDDEEKGDENQRHTCRQVTSWSGPRVDRGTRREIVCDFRTGSEVCLS